MGKYRVINITENLDALKEQGYSHVFLGPRLSAEEVGQHKDDDVENIEARPGRSATETSEGWECYEIESEDLEAVLDASDYGYQVPERYFA
jgi:hypothetical protein